MGASWLIVVMVVAGTKPVPHAYVQCAEIARHVDGQCTYVDDEGRCLAYEGGNQEEDGNGAVLKTDSRGRMYFNMDAGTLHCRAWAPGYQTWSGTFEVTDEQTPLIMSLTRLPTPPPAIP